MNKTLIASAIIAGLIAGQSALAEGGKKSAKGETCAHGEKCDHKKMAKKMKKGKNGCAKNECKGHSEDATATATPATPATEEMPADTEHAESNN